MTHEFLRQLAEYVNGGEELDILPAGFMKYRFRCWRNGTSFATVRSFAPI